ncbi:MAG: hypothetical protein GF346_04845, partial [Candidatus Eisenbacteria bacterium]|nr:hypothetical protein [Candidatus Latescibacterota bacterium]MBD3301754.1 hypothetical protein [Candidatus Eisenbacteria bacterium]
MKPEPIDLGALLRLARLALSEEETARLETDLQRLIPVLERLETMDLGDADAIPTAEAERGVALREDRVRA